MVACLFLCSWTPAHTIFDRKQRSKSGLKNYLVVVVVLVVGLVVQYLLN